MPEAAAIDHHGSHRALLWPLGRLPGQLAGTRCGIDAIFVPTARSPTCLRQAVDLAQDLSCTLVTLHSTKWTTVATALKSFPADIDLIAIDVPAPAQLNLPASKSARLLAGTVFGSRSDLSTKRNMALMISRMLGWSRILFLDDDITGLNPDDILQAVGLLDAYNAVGLRVDGFPDNSVVCHAYRQAGGKQQTFIGGGALAVEVGRCKSFFPDIYNDDWLFMLDEKGRLQPATTTGRVAQSPYDPFRDVGRARSQELGDVLAEGIYWLLDQGHSVFEADEQHWEFFLAKRRRFIERVLDMVVEEDDIDLAEKRRRIAALSLGSLSCLALITPALCTAYLQAWATDRERWQQHLDQLPVGLTRQQVLSALTKAGQPPLTSYVRERNAGLTCQCG